MPLRMPPRDLPANIAGSLNENGYLSRQIIVNLFCRCEEGRRTRIILEQSIERELNPPFFVIFKSDPGEHYLIDSTLCFARVRYKTFQTNLMKPILDQLFGNQEEFCKQFLNFSMAV